MKVLIADKFPDLYLKKLQELGLDVVYNPKMGEEDIANNSKDFNIIIVRSTKVNAKAIENSTNLNLIIRAGAGVDNIDIQAAKKKRHLCSKLSREKFYCCGRINHRFNVIS